MIASEKLIGFTDSLEIPKCYKLADTVVCVVSEPPLPDLKGMFELSILPKMPDIDLSGLKKQKGWLNKYENKFLSKNCLRKKQ